MAHKIRNQVAHKAVRQLSTSQVITTKYWSLSTFGHPSATQPILPSGLTSSCTESLLHSLKFQSFRSEHPIGPALLMSSDFGLLGEERQNAFPTWSSVGADRTPLLSRFTQFGLFQHQKGSSNVGQPKNNI